MSGLDADVIVVGGGNAGLCAALAAREQRVRVLLLECAPPEGRGGNAAFCAGSIRVAYRSREDVLRLFSRLPAEEAERLEIESYPEETFFDDLARLSGYRADADQIATLVGRSLDTAAWLRDQGLPLKPGGGDPTGGERPRRCIPAGEAVKVRGAGRGLVDGLYRAAARAGVQVRYQTRAVALLAEDDRIVGVRARRQGRTAEVRARAVVLASGGFEANAAWRAQYLGPGWELARVRGSRFNVGDGIRMALEAGAVPCGNWSGSLSAALDPAAPEFGDPRETRGYQRRSYPYGILVNTRGRRFTDEGRDTWNYTFADMGRIVLAQPGHIAWQVFDAKVAPLLRSEYHGEGVTRVSAESLEALAAGLHGMDGAAFLRTVAEYNAAVDDSVAFDPSRKDGRATRGLDPDKSNWANTIDRPPFLACAVTCGIHFTFGGIKTDLLGRVLDDGGRPVPGLFAAGALVGGTFHLSVPGGAARTRSSVFGRIAGASAGRAAMGAEPALAAAGA
ncbi:MAG: FAD-dependent tricarballylate dehydrogenase TcuA [Proteobacteria bacterium]|nr:FAD-dependent tricarballylate dehydrogenase TcuA [Pseudomonadota bacterium]